MQRSEGEHYALWQRNKRKYNASQKAACVKATSLTSKRARASPKCSMIGQQASMKVHSFGENRWCKVLSSSLFWAGPPISQALQL
eukprot:scaffold25772_cov15-Tisochrysis_lutea.AAC.1